MISNQSLRAPGLASFCFLTTSKSEKETIFLIVIIVARVGASLPTPGPGASVMPRLHLATAAGSSPASTNRSPPGPEARMRAWVRQGWSQDKNREAELRRGASLVHWGRGRPVGGGGGAQRERETIGSPEPRRRRESVWDGRQDRMVVTRTLETVLVIRQCWLHTDTKMNTR